MKVVHGGHVILRTLQRDGVDTYFTNPGTSEIHFVDALSKAEGVRPVLTLFEGVATGAADGYGRMRGRPAATLLHLGPGLANGLANLHNARRARTPIVNIVGDHTVPHAKLDPPLASDIAALAGTASTWVKRCETAEEASALATEAVAAAGTAPGGIATFIVPADVAWSSAPDQLAPPLPARTVENGIDVREIARELNSAARVAILAGGSALREGNLRLLDGIASKLEATLYCETFFARMERGRGRVEPKRLPYFPEQAKAELAAYDCILLVGARDPIAFFAYPSVGGRMAADGVRPTVLAGPDEDCEGPIAVLAESVGEVDRPPHELPSPDVPTFGELTPVSLGVSLAALLPPNAIVIDESNTSGGAAYKFCAGAQPHSWLTLTGGALGQGLPSATGAAIACPDRKVVSLQADGSAMYTLTALWTHAREQLDIVTVLLNNRSYAILTVEFERLLGASPIGSTAVDQFALDRPALDFVKLSEGMGVPATRAATLSDFVVQFREAVQKDGPRLIEVRLDTG